MPKKEQTKKTEIAPRMSMEDFCNTTTVVLPGGKPLAVPVNIVGAMNSASILATKARIMIEDQIDNAMNSGEPLNPDQIEKISKAAKNVVDMLKSCYTYEWENQGAMAGGAAAEMMRRMQGVFRIGHAGTIKDTKKAALNDMDQIIEKAKSLSDEIKNEPIDIAGEPAKTTSNSQPAEE